MRVQSMLDIKVWSGMVWSVLELHYIILHLGIDCHQYFQIIYNLPNNELHSPTDSPLRLNSDQKPIDNRFNLLEVSLFWLRS